jgi:hypothetical protein
MVWAAVVAVTVTMRGVQRVLLEVVYMAGVAVITLVGLVMPTPGPELAVLFGEREGRILQQILQMLGHPQRTIPQMLLALRIRRV